MPLLSTPGPRKYSCGECGEDCLYEGIFCDKCETWRHVACERISVKDQQTFKELPADFPYICNSCRKDSRGSFNFAESLHRLHKAAKQGYEKLETAVIRESLFIKDRLATMPQKHMDPKIDTQAQSLFEKYLHDSKPLSTPIRVTADGNSLFSAVSVAVSGKEKLATELRVRCCIEMVTYAAFYQWQQNHESLKLCAPEYADSCLNCATPDAESCIWTMSALASVIGTRVKSVYPPVNGGEDTAVSTLNVLFYPRVKEEKENNKPVVSILWSNRKLPRTAHSPGSWVPDHFVPLVDVRSLQMSPVMASLQPSRVSGRKRKPTAKLLETAGGEEGSFRMVGTVDEDVPEPDTSGMDSEDQTPSKRRRKIKALIMDEKTDLDWQRKYTHDAVGGKPLPGASFLPVKDVYDILTTAKDALPSIPRGRKNDVYFVVDNSKNSRHPARRNFFVDDCGTYKQRCGTTCKSWYLYKDGNVFALNKVDGKYCKETKVVPKSPKGKSGQSGKEVKWIPMDPQPDEGSLMLLHRYYAVLQCDPYYRRRISWFSKLPEVAEGGLHIMVVEYLNKLRSPRGSSHREAGTLAMDDGDEENAEASATIKEGDSGETKSAEDKDSADNAANTDTENTDTSKTADSTGNKDATGDTGNTDASENVENTDTIMNTDTAENKDSVASASSADHEASTTAKDQSDKEEGTKLHLDRKAESSQTEDSKHELRRTSKRRK